ncbi:MAG: hypothetical protein AB7E49_11645, partial [Campylobacterales bacterium]
MKKTALTALVLGSLANAGADQLILQNPDKVYKQLGKQYRFGEPIERPNGANKTAVSPETGPETSPNLPEPA